jgi:glycosyltransferase involved in cell wall biosynthesis
LNIALVVPEFPPDTIGGGGPVFASLAATLSRRGHNVRVLTSRTHGAPPAGDRGYPFPVHRVAQLRHFSPQYRTYMPPSPFALAGVRAFLAGSDVYHLHGYGMAFVDTVFNFFVPANRSVFTTHGFPYTARTAGGALSAAYAAYDAVFGSRILRRSRVATAVSSLLAWEAQAASGREVAVVPNGFVPLEASAQLDPRFEREMDKGPFLLGVGRLEELKGFQFAIEALAQLRARDPALRLVLAGYDNGAERGLRDLAKRLGVAEAVSFPGAVPRDQIAHVYDRAACVVVSSKYESFSLVTLEAMSRGVPCVASAVGGVLDIATDGVNALLFSVGDVSAMAACIERVRTDAGLRDRIAAAGRATVEQYSWDDVARRYEQLYGVASQ